MTARAQYLHQLAQARAQFPHDPPRTGDGGSGEVTPGPGGPVDGPEEPDDEGVFVFGTDRHQVQDRPKRRGWVLPLAVAGVAAPVGLYLAMQLGADETPDAGQLTAPTVPVSPTDQHSPTSDGASGATETTQEHAASETSEATEHTPTTDIWPTTPAQPGFLATAAAMPAAPTIDGSGGEWGAVTGYTSDQLVFQRDGFAGSTNGVTAFWRLGWDASAYYVYVEVKDSVLTQRHPESPSQLWNGDSVHFEFGPYADQVRTDRLDQELRHVMLAPTEDGRFLMAMNVADGSTFTAGPAVSGHQVAGALLADGYAIEAAIPWTALGVSGVSADMAFVTNLNVSDAVAADDGVGNLGQMWSSNPFRTFNNLGTRPQWGVVTLTG